MKRPAQVILVGLVAGAHGGVSRYTVALASALDTVASEYGELGFTLLTTTSGADAVRARTLRVRIVAPPSRLVSAGPARLVTEQIAAKAARADLLHFFDLSGPLLAPRRPFVATIHDVSVLHGYRVFRQMHKRRLHPWAIHRARAIVAISQFAKTEAVRRMAAAPERIHVIHSGPGFEPLEDGARATPRVRPPYLLFVGNLTASKNLPFLVRAFERSAADTRLVLAGRQAEHYDDLKQAIEASPRRERIVVAHDVGDRELDALYRNATALLLPSRYEGFAFTPLEAMLRGCPVVASDIPAVREVSGEGAWLVDVDDEHAWAAAIERVVADECLRVELRARGDKAALAYSWQKTARSLCDLFVDVTRAGAS